MEAYVGEIRMFAGSYAPQGWEKCDGSLISISENEMLFSLIGTTYGGDGQNTFALPDLRGRAPVHYGASQGLNYTLGQAGGTETVTLTAPNMAAHTHSAIAGTAAGAAISPSGAYWTTSSVNSYSLATPDTQLGQISAAGGSEPHDNMMPFLPVNFIICLYGTYPQQL